MAALYPLGLLGALQIQTSPSWSSSGMTLFLPPVSFSNPFHQHDIIYKGEHRWMAIFFWRVSPDKRRTKKDANTPGWIPILRPLLRQQLWRSLPCLQDATKILVVTAVFGYSPVVAPDFFGIFLWSRRVNIGRDCVVRGCAWLICTRIRHHSVWHTPRDSRQQHHLSHDGDRVPLMLPGYVVFLTVFRRMFPLPPIFRPPAL